MVVFKGYNTRRHLHGRRVPLLEMVLRDGAIYFAVMALANLANIFTFYFAGPFTRGSLSTFSTAISVTLISRLTLNLRANASVERLPRSQTRSDSLGLRFPSALTSTLHLGSPRRYRHHGETSPSRQLQLTDLSQSTYASASLHSANASASTSATLLTPIEADAVAHEDCSDHGHGHDPNATLGRGRMNGTGGLSSS
ncbi:hypothetical protein D9758_007936 [Tetrapyrgos nigripes]|uniref:Uncharacterized protein n=1 Tax=Tetrapyrgos nigripes TaxID=182062 RepID=A0A8H5FY10_9AGAR|nr:hypothetical protein D9758_007936 [Tetrapyrgos nigripes]